MSLSRRLTAALITASLAWSTLTLGVGPPASQAATPTVSRAAPHDPATYYAGTEGLTGATLAARLHSIIDDHTRLSYSQLWTALPRTDPDPGRSDSLTDFYSGTSILVAAQCGSGSCAGKWNREHTWAQSHGNFGTGAGPGTDLFHMRPSFADSNSSRGNLDFDNGGSPGVPSCAACLRDGDSFEPRAVVKGDLARGLLYMAVRYEGTDGFADLKMNDRTCNGSGAGNHGKLSTLVAWSQADPPDAGERARNDLIDSDYQHNRNPFIDHPEWVAAIYGDGVGLGPACGSTSGSDTLPGGTTPTDPPANTAPATAPMSATTLEDTAVSVALAASDADGDPLTWSVTQQPVRGTASVAGATLTYTPTPDVHGVDSLGVTVSDGRGGSATTTVTTTVTPVNDAPVAYAVSSETPRSTSTQIALAASDVDDDLADLTYAAASSPAHGTVTITGATATYQPTTGYAGADSFTYVARDPAGASSTPVAVSITVSATPQAPQAHAVSTSTDEDRPVSFDLTATDPDGGTLRHAITAPPRHGTVTLDDARATYTPDPDFHGSDAFTWSATNATSTVEAPATIAITSVNDAPVVSAGSMRVTAGSPAAVSLTELAAADPDGDPVAISAVSEPQHGAASHTATTATYTPAVRSAVDTFTVTVSDGRGAVATAPVSVEITARATSIEVLTPPTVVAREVATTIVALGDASATPTGAVTLRASGRTLGTAILSPDGTAVVRWTPTSMADRMGLVVTYDGDSVFAPVSDAAGSVRVAGLTSAASLSAGPLRRGRAGVVRLTIRRVAGLVPGGRATVTVGRATRTLTVVDGVATIRIARLPRQGRLRVSVRYSGDRAYVPAAARRVFTLAGTRVARGHDVRR